MRYKHHNSGVATAELRERSRWEANTVGMKARAPRLRVKAADCRQIAYATWPNGGINPVRSQSPEYQWAHAKRTTSAAVC